MQKTKQVLSSLLLAFHVVSALPGPCKVIFDGRIPLSYTSATFDTNSSVFDDQFVHGESKHPVPLPLHNAYFTDQTWAQILDFPDMIPSLVRIEFHEQML